MKEILTVNADMFQKFIDKLDAEAEALWDRGRKADANHIHNLAKEAFDVACSGKNITITDSIHEEDCMDTYVWENNYSFDAVDVITPDGKKHTAFIY